MLLAGLRADRGVGELDEAGEGAQPDQGRGVGAEGGPEDDQQQRDGPGDGVEGKDARGVRAFGVADDEAGEDDAGNLEGGADQR